MKILKQSMITEHFGKDSWKQAGSIFRSSFLLGHVTKNDNRVANIGNYVKSSKQWVDLHQTCVQGLARVILVKVSLKSQ